MVFSGFDVACAGSAVILYSDVMHAQSSKRTDSAEAASFRFWAVRPMKLCFFKVGPPRCKLNELLVRAVIVTHVFVELFNLCHLIRG